MNNWIRLKNGKLRAGTQFVRDLPYEDGRDYKPEDVRERNLIFLNKLANMWGKIPGLRLSGSFGDSVLFGNIDEFHNNVDVAVLAQQVILEQMVESAVSENLFFFYRKPNFKPSLSSKSKLSVYWAVGPDLAAKRLWRNMNYQFCLVDNSGNIEPEHRVDTRINIHLHRSVSQEDVGGHIQYSDIGKLLCIEDGLVFNPSFFNTQHTISTNNGRISLLDPTYMLLKLSDLVQHRKYDKPKHHKHILAIKRYLAARKLKV